MRALTALINRTLAETSSGNLTAPFDPAWRSPCEQHQDQDFTYWRPVAQETPVEFAGLEHALELVIHPDIKAYYGSYWSGSLEGSTTEGPLSLIQLWNTEDFDRLIANLIGHALAKQRLKQPFTVFFANTDPDTEYFLSMDNETGVVLLEEPGKPPIREVASSIHAFLDRITPEIRPPALY